MALDLKKIDCSPVKFMTIEEGLCVQMMHMGTYDNEPETVVLMDVYILQNGYENDFGKDRLHHEIYLSDPRKSTSDKMRTVIRHPIRKR